MKIIKTKVKAVVEQFPIRVIPHPFETNFVGIGDVGNEKNGTLKTRRFLQRRNSIGLCSYFYWSLPEKGKEVVNVMRFRRVMEVYPKQIEVHFAKNKSSKKPSTFLIP